MKKIYEGEDKILYRTAKGKDITLQKGDVININIVLDFNCEVLDTKGDNAIMVKEHEVTRKETILRRVQYNGSISGFHPIDKGSIPFIRSKHGGLDKGYTHK